MVLRYPELVPGKQTARYLKVGFPVIGREERGREAGLERFRDGLHQVCPKRCSEEPRVRENLLSPVKFQFLVSVVGFPYTVSVLGLVMTFS